MKGRSNTRCVRSSGFFRSFCSHGMHVCRQVCRYASKDAQAQMLTYGDTYAFEKISRSGCLPRCLCSASAQVCNEKTRIVARSHLLPRTAPSLPQRQPRSAPCARSTRSAFVLIATTDAKCSRFLPARALLAKLNRSRRSHNVVGFNPSAGSEGGVDGQRSREWGPARHVAGLGWDFSSSSSSSSSL